MGRLRSARKARPGSMVLVQSSRPVASAVAMDNPEAPDADDDNDVRAFTSSSSVAKRRAAEMGSDGGGRRKSGWSRVCLDDDAEGKYGKEGEGVGR